MVAIGVVSISIEKRDIELDGVNLASAFVVTESLAILRENR